MDAMRPRLFKCMWYQFNTDLSTPIYQHQIINTELSTPIYQHRIINTGTYTWMNAWAYFDPSTSNSTTITINSFIESTSIINGLKTTSIGIPYFQHHYQQIRINNNTTSNNYKNTTTIATRQTTSQGHHSNTTNGGSKPP